MKNGEKPSRPVLHTIDGNWQKEPIEEYMGLTKREYFAAIAMQGLIAANVGIWGYEQYSGLAIRWADELLKQLENER